MQKESVDFLRDLIEAPSPSGFEQPAQRVVRRRMKPIADTVETDVHGNVICGLNPKGKPRVMLAGHCDQIGMMVRYITDDGYVHFAQIGGIDASVLPGTRLVVHNAKGTVMGVVGRKAVHLMSPEERGKGKIELKDLWLDVGAADRKQAESRVRVGDPITFPLSLDTLKGDIVTGPGFDDKVGSFVVMEALRVLKGRRFSAAVFAVSTVQEEIGLRGARTSCFGLDPQVGIAVDVTHASDYPGADKKQTGELSLGKGPVIEIGANINPTVSDLFLKVAKRKRIPHQVAGSPGATGTDANAIQISRAGVAAGLIGVPNRYMHTPVEVVHLRDLENAAKLIAELICELKPRTSFIPR